jgi:hypothetical protein
MSKYSSHSIAPPSRPTSDTPAARQPCCGGTDFSKLGRCLRCVVLASVLAPIGWTGFYLARRHHSPGWLAYPVLAMSALFSLLLVAHALAFLRSRQETSG